jgi:hypothetical protein
MIEVTILLINLISMGIAAFAAFMTWKEYQRKQLGVTAVNQTAVGTPRETFIPQAADYVEAVVKTIRKQNSQSTKTHLLFIFLMMLVALGIFFPVIYFFLPFGDAEAMRNLPLWRVLTFLVGPILAVSVIGAMLLARSGAKQGKSQLQELLSVLNDPRLTPATGAQIVRSFTYNRAAYETAVPISLLILDTLAATSTHN